MCAPETGLALPFVTVSDTLGSCGGPSSESFRTYTKGDSSSIVGRSKVDRQKFEAFARMPKSRAPSLELVDPKLIATSVLLKRLAFPFATEHVAFTVKELETELSVIEFEDESAVQLMGQIVDLDEALFILPQRVEWHYFEMFGAPTVPSLFEDESTSRFAAAEVISDTQWLGSVDDSSCGVGKLAPRSSLHIDHVLGNHPHTGGPHGHALAISLG